MRFLLFIFIFLFSQLQQIAAQNVTVSGATTGNGSYATLGAAFTAINGGAQTGAIISISITANTSEGATAALNQSAGVWTSVTITPSGNRTIQGSNTVELIALNGADNVTLDGLNDGTNSLIIDNTSNTASNGTIRLYNDAQYNIIRNCTLKGSSTAVNSGVVYFGNAHATSLQGNDNNTISSNIIRESSTGKPIFGVYSFGTSGAPTAKWNSNNSISTNQFINVVNLSAVSTSNGAGIQLTNGANTDWTITGNSFYFTSSVTSTAATNNYGIRITGGNGFNFSITGNYFGGTAVNCGGTAMTWSNTTNGNKYCAIDVNVATTGTATSIQGNTIANITLNTNSNANTTPGVFGGIVVEAGQVNIGNVTTNLIGSNTTNGSITLNTAAVSTAQAGVAYGIAITGAGTFTISNNQVSGYTATGSTNNNAISFYGIYVSSGSGTISSNTIGSTTLSNSIQNSTGLSFTTSAVLAGIYQTATGSNLTISSNVVSNLNSSISNAVWQVAGIVTQAATNTISGNTIKYLSNSATNTGTGFSSSIVGINTANGGGTAQTISQNIIYDLKNSNAGNGAYSVIGIVLGNSGSGHVVSQNMIYDLKCSNSGTSAPMDGIRISTGTMTISNNMISIGNALSNNPFINAINIQGGTPTLYYNTVVVTGAASGSASFCNCVRMQAGSAGTIFQNNIFYNNRTSGTAGNNSVLYFAINTQVTNVSTCNYNDLYNNVSNTVLVTVTGTGTYADLSAWQTSGFSKDANSISLSVAFLNIISDLHLDPSASCNFLNKGIPVSTTIDYDNEVRNPSTPDIGADEIGNAVWTGVTSSDWNVSSNWSPAVVPTSTSDVVIPSGTPYSCTISSANANAHSIIINSAAILSMINSRLLTVSSNSCGNATFTVSGAFSAGSSSEEVAFNGAAVVTGTVSFNIVSTNNSLTFSTTTTVNKKFRIDAGGYVNANPPIYTTGSATLQYNTGGVYGRYLEWSTTSGAGYPNHVQISNNTTLDLGNGGTNVLRKCGGDLAVDADATLSMNYGANQMTDDLTVLGDILINGTLTQSALGTAPYNDINVSGNWTRGASGVFNPNCRSVFFNSTSADQTVTVTGGGTETFNYVGIDKSGKKLLLGSNTDMKISATNGCGLGNDYLTITNGDIDLQGRTLYFEGPTGLTPGTNVMNLSVKNGTRSILSSVAGGIVDLSSTLNSKTLKIVDGGGTGKILFGSNVEVRVASGEIDFGTGNLGTINYILRINSGGAVVGNAAYYAQGSKLIFSTGTAYDIVATQQSWETGTLGTTPGVPWNVDVNLALTDVRISDNLDRCVRNDISILNGTLELGASGFMSCNLTVGGDWVRNNSGTAFVPNQNKVTFNSTVNATTQLQTITVSGGGNETYYDLEENNSLGLTLSGTTNAYVTNHLYLTSGIVNTANNEVYITTSAAAAVTFDASNSSADSWINGYLRRNITTGAYDFPVGTSTILSAAGYELMSLSFTSNLNINNLRVSFTTDGTTQNEPYNVQVNGSSIGDRLDAGWWTVQPFDVTLALVAAPNCNYNIFLNERGHTNSQLYPDQYAVIKRDASYCYDVCSTAWAQCGVHDNATQWESGGTAHAERGGFTCNSFSDWAIGFATVILPIELATFNVASNSNDAVLTWLTSAEYNSDFFSVERSTDGINFVQIGSVAAAGYSLLPKNYLFTDHDIRSFGVAKVYYRLQMVDLDQSYEYSQIRWLDISDFQSVDAVQIYPNPFTNEVSFQWTASEAGNGNFIIVNELGQVVKDNQISFIAGTNFFTINQLSGLPRGVYLITVTNGRMTLSAKATKL